MSAVAGDVQNMAANWIQQGSYYKWEIPIKAGLQLWIASNFGMFSFADAVMLSISFCDLRSLGQYFWMCL